MYYFICMHFDAVVGSNIFMCIYILYKLIKQKLTYINVYNNIYIGIWPESKSFREQAGMKPIPSSWRGKCVKGEMFEPEKACNRKLIGARYYVEGFERKFGALNSSGNPEYRSPRDFLGHGTHTASTAVGAIVHVVGPDQDDEEDGSSYKYYSSSRRRRSDDDNGGTSEEYLLLGEGIARGGAPRARLAVYKACWGKDYDSQCTEADIMAAFDEALNDGVHVISASFGSTPPLLPFFKSSAAIGSFHAALLGVSVVFSAGNDGPDPALVSNVAPWSLSVAASSIDRSFLTRLRVLDAPLSFMVRMHASYIHIYSFIYFYVNNIVNVGIYRKRTYR